MDNGSSKKKRGKKGRDPEEKPPISPLRSSFRVKRGGKRGDSKQKKEKLKNGARQKPKRCLVSNEGQGVFPHAVTLAEQI